MKPLIIVTVYNRAENTQRTLKALEETTDLSEVELAIVDNGSTDGAADVVRAFAERHENVHAHGLGENIGCPRALNLALAEHRELGQPVVKLDNDVVIQTPGWVNKLQFLAEGDRVGMVSAYYRGVVANRLDRVLGGWCGDTLYRVNVIVGHCVWHSGAFLDRVGYFDVLDDEHLYGYEDLLMAYKARLLGWAMLVWEGWQIENVQRWNALGDEKDAHVRAMRPLYEARKWAMLNGGPMWTDQDGRPRTLA